MKNEITYPIKVLVLDTVMDRGGAETMIMNYMRNMDRSKVQFDFLVHREYKAAYEDEIESLGGKIYRICPPVPQNYFKYRKQIKKLFHDHSDYMIIHSNMMELSLFAFIQAKKCKIPVRICHSHIANSESKLSVKKIIRYIYRLLIQRYITHRFACGQKAGEFLYGKNKDFIKIPNAIETEKYLYNPETEAKIRKQFGIEEKYVIGHVGRFFEQKNHSFIIDIFDAVSKIDNDAVLMLVGGGELDNKLKDEIKDKVKKLGLTDKVIFTGVVENVYEMLQCFDVFIFPSLREGFPVVMVEAQAAGLKCVMSENISDECDITGNVEVLSLTDSAQKWAEHILKYKNSYTKKNMYSDIVSANFDIKYNARWLEQLYIEYYINAQSR